MIKKILVGLLLIALLLLTIMPALTGRTFNDITNENNNEWQMWSRLGIIRGYSDDTLRLKEPITKAEFITITNRALELKGDAFIKFRDVNKNSWYYKEVKTAVAVGYIQNDNYFYPNKQLTYLDITPMLYNLYEFTPANKDYLSGIDSLPEMSEDLKIQLNTLVKENILWESFLKEDKPITRLDSFYFIEQLVREKFTGSMLNMNSEATKEIFDILKLDPKKYYFYDLSDTADLQLGRTPSNQGDKDLGLSIIQRMTECAKKHIIEDKMPRPPAIWIDRNRTHIYFALQTLNRDYVAYKALILEENNQATVSNIEQVINYDRSEIVAREDKEKEEERIKELEKQLEVYMPISKELGLDHNKYYLYAPEQLNNLLQNDLEPFNSLTAEEFTKIKSAIVLLQYRYLSGGDLPFAYWIARDSSCIYAVKIEHNGTYKVYKLTASNEDDAWVIFQIETSLKAFSDSRFNIGYQIGKKLKELGVDESKFYYAPHQFTNLKLPAIAGSPDIIMKLEMTKVSLITLGGIGSIYPMYWIHENGREAYGATTKNDNHNELIIMKFVFSVDSNSWISQQVYPVFKDVKYPISKVEQDIIKKLKIDVDDYIYYPYDKRTIFAHNQGGPLVDKIWDLGERLAKTADYAFGIQFEYDDNYPNFLISKDGTKAFTLRKSMAGEEQVYLHRKEWCLYEKQDETLLFPTWSTQQVLPTVEPEVFTAPTEYISAMVKELKVNISDYIYYPQREQVKLIRRNPSLFGDSCIAGSMAFLKGNKLLREHGVSITDQEMGCFIHPSGESVYIIQKKTDGITYIYKLVLDKTPEGYVQWNDVAEWKFTEE